MREQKRFLMPDTSWDTGAMEAWLEEMFARGWHLTECGFRFATFRRGEPIRVRCRMMPAARETLEARQEREEVYTQLGWEYLANLTDRYYIYICKNPDAPELETDPVAAAWIRDRLLRKGWRDLLLAWLALAAVAAFAVYRIASSETPVETAIRGVGISAPLSAVLLAWAVRETVDTLRRVRLLRRQMAAGLPQSHTGDWRRARRRAGMVLGAMLLMDLLVIGYPFLRLGTSWGEGLDELTHPVPCLMGWQLDETLTEADRTSGTCLMNPTFLNPGHYDVWDRYTGDRSVINQCDILLLSCLAEPLYREWQTRIPVFAEAELTELDHPGFDGVSLARSGENTYLLLWQDKIVLYVGAFGVAGAEAHLDDYAALLREFQ